MMMMMINTIFTTVLVLSTLNAVVGAIECGPAGSFSIAGSSTVYPLSLLWAKTYMGICPNINITVEAGGSGAGASRVCASDKNGGTPVDIGDMSREWFGTEAVPAPNGYLYQCVFGDTDRSAIQVEVAIDGLSIATVQNGTAARCIELLGGLTTDQLRWIYTDYDPDELLATGWDSSSITNSDNDESTHLWSEIDARCDAVEIMIAGPDPLSSTFEYFLQTILIDLDNGETFDPNRPSGYFNSTDDEVIVRYTENNDAVIAFFGYAYFLKDSRLLYAVPIKNDEGNYVVPTPVTVSDGTYNPFSRRIYMNLLNDPDSLDHTRPFIQFAFSSNGTELVDDAGYVPIDETDRLLMLETLPGPGENINVAPVPSPTTSSNTTTNGTAPVTSPTTTSGNAPTTSAPVPVLSTLPVVVGEIECGPAGGFSIAGSSTVYPLSLLWAKTYMGICPNINITVEAGGSGVGASRVCASDKNGGTPVDIGDMSREWFDTEAIPAPNGYLYQCVFGDTNRSAIQVEVAIDGLSIATVQNGTAAKCIELLGGLTTDQLRWIYTDYDLDELLATGWDSSSITNSDNNELTHLWSEIDARCDAVEIMIAGPDPLSGTFEYFLQTILIDLDNDETFDPNRPSGYFNSTDDAVIVQYTENNDAVIAFFGYAYFLKDSGLLYAVPIKNDEGNYVVPTPVTVSDGTYNPFSRRIYMNLLNDPDSLDHTRPFIQFAFSSNGTELVDDTGYVPIDETDRLLMLEKLPGPGENIYVAPLPSPTTSMTTGTSPVATPTTTTSGNAPTTSGGSSIHTMNNNIIYMMSMVVVGFVVISQV